MLPLILLLRLGRLDVAYALLAHTRLSCGYATRLSCGYATRTLTVLILTLVMSKNAVAETFEQYCLTQNKTNVTKQELQKVLLAEETPEPVTLSQQNQTFTINVDPLNNLKLLLQSGNPKKTIEEIILPQEGGDIVNILGKDNWLWIDRTVTDYLIEVKPQGESAYFNPPKELPELYIEPCSLIKQIFNKCEFERNSYYSTTLNRAFVSGYRHHGWRQRRYIHLQFISGEEKAVPESLAKANFIADIPQWHGVLFQNPSGEALLYDGKTVTNISDDFLQLESGDKFQDWEVQKTLSGKTFIGQFVQRSTDDPLFLLELTEKPGFKPIDLPSELTNKWFKVFTMSSDSQSNLLIITRNKILTQVNQEIQTVATMPTSLFVYNPASVGQLADGTIVLTLKNKTSNSLNNYFLQKSSSSDNCEIMLKLSTIRSSLN
jgi:hypothetical protein